MDHPIGATKYSKTFESIYLSLSGSFAEIRTWETYLSRIEKMRPLESIEDAESRKQARELREWFKNEFCQRKI